MDESVLFLLVVLQAVQNKNLKLQFDLQYISLWNLINLWIWRIFCLHNYVREQDLVSYFYKHVAFLRVFFIKELAHSVIVHSSYIFWLDRTYWGWNFPTGYIGWNYAIATFEPTHLHLFIVLGELLPRKIASNPKTNSDQNPNPNRRQHPSGWIVRIPLFT